MKQSSFILLLLFTLSACKSVDKLYESGDYEQVIEKLEGKAKRNNLDRRERSLLVKAANKHFETEGSKILASSNSDHYKDWKNAKQKLKRLRKTADKIYAYPQIRESDLETDHVDDLAERVDQQLFDFTIDLYHEEIADYLQTGDREYAMRAYRHVNDLDDYGADDFLMDSLYNEAILLGHRFIAVYFDADVFHNWEFRNGFENEIDFYNDDFHTFTDRVFDDTDYEINISAEISSKDENRDNSYQEYSDRVVDYYESSIDTSTNQEVKTPVYKQVQATVKRVAYLWTVEGRVDYNIYDFRTDRRFDSGTFRTRVNERQEFYYLESGDEEAVPSSINLERNEIRGYDFDDLIEACFRELADEFNDGVNLKTRLL